MKKKVCKNVILALCILALVLQPLTVFADTVMKPNDFFDMVNSAVPSGGTQFTFRYFHDIYELNNYLGFSFTVPSVYDPSHIMLVRQAGVVFQYVQTIDLELFNYSANDIYLQVGLNYIVPDRYEIFYNYESDTVWTSQRARGDIKYYSNEVWYFVGTGSFSYYDGDNGNEYFIYLDNTNAPPATPNYPTGTGNSFTPNANENQVNWPNFLYVITSWFYYNGLMRTNFPGQSATYNFETQIGIGDALTYDFLCKTNMNNANVAWNGNSYPNYLFSMSSDIIESLENIAASVQDNDISEQITDIKDRLEMAFPDDQAEMNDSIAEQILDDSNGNGLTIDKITDAKSNLDNGLDTFKLDVSGSQYSNPFSALGNADWSFWSQTTLNNLGSGYSFEYSDAALMDGEDVFDVNQRTLLDLLGW